MSLLLDHFSYTVYAPTMKMLSALYLLNKELNFCTIKNKGRSRATALRPQEF